MLPDYLKEPGGGSLALAPSGVIEKVEKLEANRAGQWSEVVRKVGIPGIMQVLILKHTQLFTVATFGAS